MSFSVLLKYLFRNFSNPRLVLCEYNCLMDNRLFERDDDEEGLKKKLILLSEMIKQYLFRSLTISFLMMKSKMV